MQCEGSVASGQRVSRVGEANADATPVSAGTARIFRLFHEIAENADVPFVISALAMIWLIP
jgi:hypothetical protein